MAPKNPLSKKSLPADSPADKSVEPLSGAGQEEAWIEVIRKMDETYADLLRYQVELEEKNSALEEAQRFISSVLSSMTDILLVCDKQGRIQQVNRALEELTGISEPRLLGQPFSVGQGTGLGLSISYGTIIDHGGSLAAENVPGGGALFRMELPENG